MSIEITKLSVMDYDQVKDLLVDLQEYVIAIDKYNLNIISKDYREKYFDYMLQDCTDSEGCVFVAKDCDKVVGMVAGMVQQYQERDRLDYACPKKGDCGRVNCRKKLPSQWCRNSIIVLHGKLFKINKL